MKHLLPAPTPETLATLICNRKHGINTGTKYFF